MTEVTEMLIGGSAYDAKQILIGGEQRKAPFELEAQSGHIELHSVPRLNDALHAVALDGVDESAQLCTTMGTKLDARDHNGWTTLLRVAFKEKIKVVKCLIDAETKLDSVGDDGFTAVQQAVEVGQAEVALCLVVHGVRTAGI